ncbi:hypothetical protein [Ralstonia sp. Ralssp110]|uniref:hypothetical protein n=1 Tax=Ralstonia sp. Ralssp110 TaxID=3243004 RepID=UPI0039B560EA
MYQPDVSPSGLSRKPFRGRSPDLTLREMPTFSMWSQPKYCALNRWQTANCRFLLAALTAIPSPSVWMFIHRTHSLRKSRRDVAKDAKSSKWVTCHTLWLNDQQVSVSVRRSATSSVDDQLNRSTRRASVKNREQGSIKALIEWGNILELLCFPIQCEQHQVFPQTGCQLHRHCSVSQVEAKQNAAICHSNNVMDVC